MRWIPSPAPGTPSAYVERGLTIFAVLWQVAWTVSEVGPRVLGSGNASSMAVVAATIAGLIGVTVGLWGPRRVRDRVSALRAINLGLLALAVIVLATDSTGEGWPVASLMAVVSSTVLALTLRARPALIFVAATGVLTAAELTLSSTQTALDAVMFSLYGAALGCGAVVLAWGLRSTGERLDVAHAEQVRAEAQVLADQELARATLEHEVRLHDRVLNTLAAVARGGLESHGADVRSRCGQAAGELRTLTASEAPAPRESWREVDEEVALLRARGIRVEWVGIGTTELPSVVLEAAGVATAEALRNVARHSAAQSVAVRVDAQSQSLLVVIDDDGVGLGEITTGDRLGIANSIVGIMSQVGGSAELSTQPSGGTTVALTWQAPTSDRSAAVFEADVLGVLPQIAPPFLLTFLLYGAVVLIATIPLYPQPLLAMATFVVAVVCAIPLGLAPKVAARMGLTGQPAPRSLRPLLGILVAVLAPVVVYSGESSALAGSAVPAWGVWSSEVSLALLFTTIILGPRWTILPALVAWVVAQGGDPWELIRPGSLMLMIAALFAMSMHRRARQYATSMQEVISSVAAEESLRVDIERRRLRYAPIAHHVLPLLDGLCDGSLDHRQSDVRMRCAMEERFARSVVRLDPEEGALPAALVRTVVGARSRAVYVDADLTAPVPSGTTVALDVPTAEIMALPAGSSVRVTAGWEEDRLVARLTGIDGDRQIYREWELSNVR